MSAVETLIVWEASYGSCWYEFGSRKRQDLDITRHTLRTSAGEIIIIHTNPPPVASATMPPLPMERPLVGLRPLSEKDRAKFIDKATGLEMEQAGEPQSLLEMVC